MITGVIRSMLLLDEPNISGLRLGIESYSKVFLSVVFIGALVWQFITDMKFLEVVKNLVLALFFMGCFYEFHTKAVDLSFKASEELLREVSPRNIFLRRWNEVKVKTDTTNSNFIERFAIPNLNDLLGTALFLMSKVCILLLKLIYTTVYYFTFIFAPVTAVLSFLPVSKHSMGGTIISSLWCILLPFVLVVFMALVGNSVQMPAENGHLAVTSMDQLIWIFGITLLMLLAPSFTFSLIKGSIASTADMIGGKMTGVGAQALVSAPIIFGLGKKFFGKGKKDKNGNFKRPENNVPYSKNYSAGRMANFKSNGNNYQSSFKGKGGLNTKGANSNSVNLSEMKMNQHTIKQNSSTQSGAHSSNQESVKNNIITTSKIPFGAVNLNQQDQNHNISNGIIKNNVHSNFLSKNSPMGPRLTSNTETPRAQNNFRPVPVQKEAVNIRSRLSRLLPRELKNIKPKERQYEV